MYLKQKGFLITLAVLLIALISFAPAPRCGWFFPFKKDLNYELSTYNEKGKLLVRSVYTITGADSTRTLNTVGYHVSISDRRRRPVYHYIFETNCHRKGLLVDIKAFFPPDFSGALEEMYAVERADVLDFPPDMEPGDSLQGGFYTVVTYVDSVSPTPVLRMSMQISKRHVSEKTTRKIALGTFECLRITSEVRIITNGIPLSYRLEEYYNEEHGLIYSERYGWTGIRTGYTELTRIQ